MAGLIADNDGTRMPSIAPRELLGRIDRGDRVMIVDVRTPVEFAAGHVPGAINIPVQHLATRTAGVPAPKDREVVIYCGHGPRAWIAGAALRYAEFRHIIYLRGHWMGWRRARLRVERSTSAGPTSTTAGREGPGRRHGT